MSTPFSFLPRCLACIAVWLAACFPLRAATFNGNGYFTAADTTGGLSWNNAIGAQAMTVSCWFKLSFPTGFNLTQPLVIVAYGNDMNWSGTEWNQTHPYALYLNPNTGDVDFSTKGTGGNWV